jgi:hypothetical protein
MASPKIISFMVFNGAGAPLAGVAGSLSFSSYKDETGANLSQPTIVEIGGGAYYFTPVYTANHGISYVINTGANNPLYVAGYTRPEDFNTDNIDASVSSVLSAIAAIDTALGTAQADITFIRKLKANKWAIYATGPDANRMVFYDDDNETPILKVDLLDINNLPTTSNPFVRVPV